MWEVESKRGSAICFRANGFLMLLFLSMNLQAVPSLTLSLIAKSMAGLIDPTSSTPGNLTYVIFQGTSPSLSFVCKVFHSDLPFEASCFPS